MGKVTVSFIFLGHILWSFFKRKKHKTKLEKHEYMGMNASKLFHTPTSPNHIQNNSWCRKTCDLNILSALKIQFIWLICNAHEQYNPYSGYICITSIQSTNCQAPFTHSAAFLTSPFSQLKMSGAKDIHLAMNARSSLSTLQNYSLKKLFNV